MTAKRSLRVSLLLAAMAMIAAPAGAASVQPGQKFNAANVSQIADMISPGVKWCVEHGMPITVGEQTPTGTAAYARREGGGPVLLVGLNLLYYADLLFDAAR